MNGSSPPAIVDNFDVNDWRPREGEQDFQCFMRQLGEYHYHFRELNLAPEKAYLGMARLEQQLADLVNAAASLQPWGEGFLVKSLGYYIIHSFTQRSSLIGFLMGVNTMLITFALILGAGFGLMILERVLPARSLPKVEGWWGRVAIINILQASVVILGGYTWERWMMGASVFDLTHKWGVLWSSLFGYLVITFIYYWWHRWRHDSHFLWLSMHQIHHSPRRIETITSFYKHPVEIFCNSLIISATLYPLLGLTPEAGAWVTVLTSYAEFFYHMNLKTPRWMGYLLQRPEMHRYHHEFEKHYGNFADLPLWDMLFGTHFNPKKGEDTECGFEPHREARFSEMLFFKDVHTKEASTATSEVPGV
jgi:sterol desaturase/sphingolipid hydroxylase (fatty acid hydroxylase superfamily)